MSPEELNFNLFVKMSEEMRMFCEWLKTQPAEEIINHSYEYAVKADILSGMEAFNLSESRARALLSLANPLDGIYKAYDNQGLTLIDLMMETAESYADEIIEQHTANAEVSVYPHSEAYAQENDEWEMYQQSAHLNIQCKEAIEEAIVQYYSSNNLDPEAVRQVAEQFGVHRVRFVMANTILAKIDDQQLDTKLKTWAKSVPVFSDRNDSGENNRTRYVVDVRAHAINAFAEIMHRVYPLTEVLEKESVCGKLKVKPQKISRNFRRISSKGQDR